jgi:hypothetical protein
VFCWSMFVFLSVFFWSLYCLTTSLVSSNISCRFCPIDLCLFAIALSVLLRFTGSDYTFGIFKLFLQTNRDLLYRCLSFWSFLRLKFTSDIFTINDKYLLDKRYVNLINVKHTKSKL